MESQRTVSTTSLLSTNAESFHKRFPALQLAPFTPSPKSLITILPAPVPSPSLMSQAVVPTPKTWQGVSEGIAMSRTSPAALVTAPVTSPYPFVCRPHHQASSDVPSDLFKNLSTSPIALKSKFAFTLDPPDHHVTQDEFLKMGHAPECWCDNKKRVRQAVDLVDQAKSHWTPDVDAAQLDNVVKFRPRERTVGNNRTSPSGTPQTDKTVHLRYSPSDESPPASTKIRFGVQAGSPVDTSRSEPFPLSKVMKASIDSGSPSCSDIDVAGLFGDPHASLEDSGSSSLAETQMAPVGSTGSDIFPNPVDSGMNIDEIVAQLGLDSGVASRESILHSALSPFQNPLSDSTPRAASSDATTSCFPAFCSFSRPRDDAESDLSDGDAVMVTPTSEETDFMFHRPTTPSSEGADYGLVELEVIEGVPFDSDEDWTSISRNLRAYRPGSLPSSRAASEASVHTWSGPHVVSSHPVAISSLPLTPSSSANGAGVSNAGSETKQEPLHDWDEYSVHSIEEELWDAKAEPEVMHMDATEWPTLREAMAVRSSRKQQGRERDDEWGGKVWDGVSDWFL